MKINLHMTPGTVMIGSVAVFMVGVFFVVFLPLIEYDATPSDIWHPRTEAEERGRQIYMENGCTYCHSQFVRQQDWDYGSTRIAQAGDYVADEPVLWGTERQGPDLSQAGGLRSDGWHHAHFINPRYTRPDSIMPPFHWWTLEERNDVIAYVQGLGFDMAQERYDRYELWRGPAYEAWLAGGEANTAWLHRHVPTEWMEMPNPYPADEASLEKGSYVYQHYCIGCHGPVGDGAGPGGVVMREMIAQGELEEAPPYNFTFLNRWVAEQNPDRSPIGGMIYYQVMNGITGTSMPVFKNELESEKIWHVANYLAVNFVGHYAEGQSEVEWYREVLGRQYNGIPATYEQPTPREMTPIPVEEVIAEGEEALAPVSLDEPAEEVGG